MNQPEPINVNNSFVSTDKKLRTVQYVEPDQTDFKKGFNAAIDEARTAILGGEG